MAGEYGLNMPGLTPLFTATVIAAAVPLGWTAHLAARALVAADERATPPAAYVIGAAMIMAAIVLAAIGVGDARVNLLPGVVLGWGLLVLAAVDLTTLRLPDLLTLPLAATGLGLAASGLIGAMPSTGFDAWGFADHAVGAAVGYGALALLALAFRKLRGHDGLGLGDAKLAAVAGAWLGALALPATVLIACALAFIWIGMRMLRHGRKSLRAPLPFGPALAAGTWIVWTTTVTGAWTSGT